MKIQCSTCQKAEAIVLCCADEAALCWACDEKIHAANKLASKHQRLSLYSSPSNFPKCDVCQETSGYFFCLEDRALLCRKCDVAIHTSNAFVSAHQRFLLTGVKVGLEPAESVVSSSKKMNSEEKSTEIPSKSLSKSGNSIWPLGENKNAVSGQAVRFGGSSTSEEKESCSSGTLPGMIPGWPLLELLGVTDVNQNFGFMDQGSTKDDSMKLEDSGWSPIYRAATTEDVDIGECLGLVPEIQRTVLEIPSSSPASGLFCPRDFQNNILADNSAFVPDVSLQKLNQNQLNQPKCRRQTVPEIPSSPPVSGLFWPRNFQNNILADNSAFVPDVCSQKLNQNQLNQSKRRRQT